MSGYTELIRSYATDTSRTGRLADPDGTGEVGLTGSERGQRLAVRFTLNLAGARIAAIRFQVFGCGYTMAACAAAAEQNEGRLLNAAGPDDPAAIDRTLGGLPVDRRYCADLASQALRAALASARQRTGIISTAVANNQKAAATRFPARQKALYQRLLACTPRNPGPTDDHRLFAGALAAAAQDEGPLTAALGLTRQELAALMDRYFPDLNDGVIAGGKDEEMAGTADDDLRNLLFTYLPTSGAPQNLQSAAWLARLLAARAARPGHLWVAMGLAARSELSAAIRRHLPALAEANHRGMRWKRFFFKQLCERQGDSLCRTPNCGECSEYTDCYPDEDA